MADSRPPDLPHRFIPDTHYSLGVAVERAAEIWTPEEFHETGLSPEGKGWSLLRRTWDDFRQKLFAGKIPAQLITEDGYIMNVPTEYWGSDLGDRAFGKVTIQERGSFWRGYIIIPKDALENFLAGRSDPPNSPPATSGAQARTVKALAEWFLGQSEEDRHAATREQAAEYLKATGHPVRSNMFDQVWKKAREVAGLPPKGTPGRRKSKP